jgi:hypothetical protein
MEHEVKKSEVGLEGSGGRDQRSEDRKDLEDSSVGAAFSRNLEATMIWTT